MKLRTALIFAVDVMLGLSAWSQEHSQMGGPSRLLLRALSGHRLRNPQRQLFLWAIVRSEGGGGGIVRNFGHMFGFKAEFQGYGSQTKAIIIPAGNPFLPAGGAARVQGNLFTYMFGPQISIFQR